MTAIKLAQNWILGARIGAGGFGRVFAAENEDGLKAAVKLVPKAPGADRELLFVDLKDVRGIVRMLREVRCGVEDRVADKLVHRSVNLIRSGLAGNVDDAVSL